MSSTQPSTFWSLSSSITTAISTPLASSSHSTLDLSVTQAPSIPSTSSTSITTRDQPSVTAVDPPSSTTCNAASTGKYVDVHADDAHDHAKEFCDKDLPPNCSTTGYVYQYELDLDKSVVGYNISVTLISICTKADSDCKNPLPNTDFDCSYNLWTAWWNCTHNKGMGGTIRAGCLIYNISPIAY